MSSQFRMIDVGEKAVTRRRAVATGFLWMSQSTRSLVLEKKIPKGDVLAISEVAGISAAKRTPDFLPLCHPLPVEAVRISHEIVSETREGWTRLAGIQFRAEVVTSAKTGVEMEALTAVTAAILCAYDLIKAVDAALQIGEVYLELKEGGKSGHWVHPKLGLRASTDELSRDLFNSRNWHDLRVAVITVSDRCSRGETEDISGKILSESAIGIGAELVSHRVIPDEIPAIREHVGALLQDLKPDVILLTGGTGLGPRDVTPEALEPLWSKKLTGVGERLRAVGAIQNARAILSRSEAGLMQKTFVACLPGSRRAVQEAVEILAPLIPHALHVSKGGGH